MFRRVGDSIWRATGRNPGKKVVVLGGVHGNEATGIHVIRKLLNHSVDQGSVTLAIGNPRACEINQRGSSPHADLNRCFTVNDGDIAATSPYEAERASILKPYLRDCDVLLDIHSTNKPSEPFVRVGGNMRPEHERIARWLPGNKLVWDPNYLLAGEIALSDEYVGFYGGIGICYESGQAQDISMVDEIYFSVLNILSEETNTIKHCGSSGQVQRTKDPLEMFEIISAFTLTSKGYSWEEDRGLKNFSHVPAGEIVGTVYYSNTVMW